MMENERSTICGTKASRLTEHRPDSIKWTLETHSFLEFPVSFRFAHQGKVDRF